MLDDELGKDQALTLLKKLKTDQALQSKMQNYHVIGRILRNDGYPLLDNRFAEKISQQIQQEPSFLLPARKPTSNWHKTGLALAASLLLGMIWVANKLEKQDTPYGQPQYAVVLPSRPQLQHDPANDRFNDLLQAHDNAVYVNPVGRAQPYARVAGFQQE